MAEGDATDPTECIGYISQPQQLSRLTMFACLSACSFVCMNVDISGTIRARETKFGMKVIVFQKQIKLILKLGCLAY